MAKPSLLSVLIPVRAAAPEFALSRLAMRDASNLPGIEVIVTDDGSSAEAGNALRDACTRRGWIYHRIETEDRPFSLARARNAGLAMARGQYVLFDDLDMVYPSDFLPSLMQELALLELGPLSFLSLPVLYLSEASTRRVVDKGSVDPFAAEFLSRMQFEDPRGHPANQTIDHFAPASAILAMPTETARGVGGYDEAFEGWGGEDRDFIFRLLAANDALPLPVAFGATRLGNLADVHRFEGWRALFRLHGDYCARKGLYGYHLHHAPNDWRKGRSNIERAAKKALAMTDSFSRVETSAHQALRRSTLFSSLGEVAPSQVPQLHRPAGGGRFRARIQKLRRDPHAFFRDSRLPFARLISRLFSPRTDVL